MQSGEIQGRCHCGNLSAIYTLPPQLQEIPARACDCGFCTRHGARWTSDPLARLRINVANPEQLHKYRFASNSADFLICRQCGVPLVALSEIEQRLFAVLNVNCLILPEGLRVLDSGSSFSGEALTDRLTRRARNWIGDVDVG